MFVLIALSVILSLVIWRIFYSANRHAQYKSVPCPPGYPVIGNVYEFMITSRDADIVQEYKDKEGQWEDFDKFVHLKNTVWKINMTVGCSCSLYSKFYNCKHYLGMKIHLKLGLAPLEAKLIPLSQKRKRGRPALAKQALIIQ